MRMTFSEKARPYKQPATAPGPDPGCFLEVELVEQGLCARLIRSVCKHPGVSKAPRCKHPGERL